MAGAGENPAAGSPRHGDDRRRRRRRRRGVFAILPIRMMPRPLLAAAATLTVLLAAASSPAVAVGASSSTSAPPPPPPRRPPPSSSSSPPPSTPLEESKPTPPPPSPPRWGAFSPSKLRRLLAARCDFSPSSTSGGGCAVWVYSGSVSDPFTGRRICDVEGIELTRRLAENVHPSRSSGSSGSSASASAAAETNRGRLGDLRARDLLFPPSSPSEEGGVGGGGRRRRKGRRRKKWENNGGINVNGESSPSSSSAATATAHSADDAADGEAAVGGERRQRPHQQPEWDYAGTVLSRRLFCYVDPDTTTSDGGGGSGGSGSGGGGGTPAAGRRILSKIRLRPGGKERKIDLREAVALYDTATTYVSRDWGRRLVVQTEFPDGRTVTVSAQPSPSASSSPDEVGEMEDEDEGNPASSFSPSTFEFTAYGRLSRRDGANAAGRLLAPIPPGPLSSSSTLPPPPRSRWIQFGPGDGTDDGGGKYGARESYSFSNLDAGATGPGVDAKGGDDDSVLQRVMGLGGDYSSGTERGTAAANPPTPVSSAGRRMTFLWNDWTRRLGALTRTRKSPSSAARPTVRYTRYGECPPWYGPNKMCTLELVGTRVESLLDAPPLCAGLASHDIPGFAAVHAPIPCRDDRDDCQEDDGIGDDEDSGAGSSYGIGPGRTPPGRGMGHALDALRWFRLDNLRIDEDDNPSFDGRRSISSAVRNMIRRLGAATTRQS